MGELTTLKKKNSLPSRQHLNSTCSIKSSMRIGWTVITSDSVSTRCVPPPTQKDDDDGWDAERHISVIKDLGFDQASRVENIRRIGEVSLLFALSSTISVTAFISPYISDRQLARELHEKHSSAIPFIEVFIDAPLSVVEQRDPKGLYKKARAGEIKDFTGISAPYEAPANPEIHIRTDEVDVAGAVEIITKYLADNGLIPA